MNTLEQGYSTKIDHPSLYINPGFAYPDTGPIIKSSPTQSIQGVTTMEYPADTPILPPLVAFYDETWPRYVRAPLSRLRKLGELKSQEGAIIEEIRRESFWGVFEPDTRKAHEELRGKARDMVSRLVWLAVESFSPRGFRLEIDSKPYLNEYVEGGENNDAYLSFSPVALWRRLESEYANNTGQETAHRQTAERLVKEFNIQRDAPVNVKAGCLVLDVPVRLDDFHKKFGRNRLTYHDQEQIRRVLIGLEGFIAWTGDDTSRLLLKTWAQGLVRREYEIVSKKRTEIATGLWLTTYFNRFEFRFSPALGEQLTAFLGLYGTDAMRPAQAA